ncbi:MAG TPA: LuxR C-terminal-related transcriptional regulator [Geobacteraceae bacterium]
MNYLERIISKRDAMTLLEVICDCLSCANTSDAFNIMHKISMLIDFNNVVYGLARLSKDGYITCYDTINFSYPTEWLSIYQKKKFHEKDPIALENFSNFKLQYWADTYKKYQIDKEFINLSGDFNLTNGYASGAINQSRTEGCLLSIAGNLEKHLRNDYILNNLSPHLHVAFSNVLHKQNNQKTLLQISIREKEVLNWVKYGKSTWDISKILNISERTVKYHINNIMRKLDAVSRPHAVAIALATGLIDFG